MRLNPFNPQQPAKSKFFVGREQEIQTFRTFLFQTMNASPMNLSVTGDRGMGKTSLLIKFEEMAREQNCLTLRLSNYEGSVNNIIELSNFLIDNIKAEILSRSTLKKSIEEIRKFLSDLSPQISYGDVTLALKREKTIIQELIVRQLSSLWDKVKDNYKAIVLLIDEAETLEKLEALTFLREIFQKVEANCNYMVVLAGKLNFPEIMSETFSPLNRFFPAQRLKPLTKNAMQLYLNEKLHQTQVKIKSEAIKAILDRSEGHPYVFVSMCYWVFDSLADTENLIDKLIVGRCMDKIRKRLTEDFFLPMIQPLAPATKKILCKLITSINSLHFTFKEALQVTSIPANKLSPYLGELVGKGVIHKISRAHYKIFHSLFRDYLLIACKNNLNN